MADALSAGVVPLARGRARAWRPRDWRYAGGQRDLRIDLLRGLAVVAMIVDHVGGDRSWLYALTGGDRFLISAAEAFVFISGLVMGLVYARAIVREGLAAGLMKTLKRARTLYGLTVLLTIAFVALSLGLRLPWAPPANEVRSPAYLIGVLTLHQTFYLTDILLMYTFLVFGAGLALLLLSEGQTALVLGGSWTVWALSQRWPDQTQLPWPIAQNDLFHLATWQVLFVTGLVLGHHWRALERRCARLPLGWVLAVSGGALALAVAVYQTHYALLLRLWPGTSPDWLLAHVFAKESVGPGRLLVFAALATFALTLTTLAWRPLHRALGWLLLPLGQHALTAYALHLFVVALLVKAAPVALGAAPRTASENSAVQLCGVALVWTAIRLQGPVLVAVRPAAQRLATLPAALLPRAARPAAIVALATRRSRGL